jgi:dihydroorotate dehydrogenase (fumarate)
MLKSSVALVNIDCCIYNASGPLTNSIANLIEISHSKSGAILSKSATLLEQDGNEHPRVINNVDLGNNYCKGSINSEGLPNGGIDYCKYTFVELQSLHYYYYIITSSFNYQ